MGTLEEMGEWYVDNVYTYLAGTYGANRDDNNNLIYYKDTNNKTFYGFPTENEEYYEQFLERFKEKYANANGKDIKDKNNNITKKSVRTKRTENIKDKSNGVFAEDYLDNEVIDGGNIDENWNVFELCKRDCRGADVVSNAGETLKRGTNQRGSYICELIGGNVVKDDCGGFASVVLYKFIKDNKIGDYKNYKYADPWSSYQFAKSSEVKNELQEYGFYCYEGGELNNDVFTLEKGDLLCSDGHVEFYKGEENSKSFGWGNTHNTYEKYYGLEFILSSYYDDTKPSDKNPVNCFFAEGDSRPYIRVYRYEGVK